MALEGAHDDGEDGYAPIDWLADEQDEPTQRIERRALENLQGTHHTFYAGEVMSFATVEICARYAKALVARGFK